LGIAALEGKPLPSDALEKEASYIHPPGAIITKANINRFRCEWGAAGPSGA